MASGYQGNHDNSITKGIYEGGLPELPQEGATTME